MRITSCIIILFVLGTHLPLAVAAESTILTVCYNFGCKNKGVVQLTQADIIMLGNLFTDVYSAREEREQIRYAIASIERIVARTLPTGNDVGGNYADNMIDEGQQDCIDESTNTMAYLSFLDSQGWLKWHSIQDRVRRAPYKFDDHWAAQIREHQNNQPYVVDSWFYDNGQLPVVQKLEEWQDNLSHRE